jgi:hypothetical protein
MCSKSAGKPLEVGMNRKVELIFFFCITTALLLFKEAEYSSITLAFQTPFISFAIYLPLFAQEIFASVHEIEMLSSKMLERISFGVSFHFGTRKKERDGGERQNIHVSFFLLHFS